MKKILFFLLISTAALSQPYNGSLNDSYLVGQSGLTAIVNNILPNAATSADGTDMRGYGAALVQVVSTATAGTYIFEGSNFLNTNYVAIPIWNQVGGVGVTAAITATASQIGYYVPKKFRYIRLRIATTLTGGTVQAVTTLMRTDTDPNFTQIQGTVTGLSSGQTAHSSASTGSPLRAGGRVVPTTAATVDQTLIAGDAADVPSSTSNQLIVKQFGTAELDYTFNFQSVASTTTVQQLVPASGTAGVRNYITTLTWTTDNLGAGGVAWILDGALTVSSIAITTGLVTTSAAHDLKIGDAVVFTALAGGTGVSTNTIYYVTSVGSTTTFNFSLSIGGANIVPSVAYTGTTCYRVLYQQHFRSSGIDRPMNIQFNNPQRGLGNSALNFLIPTSMTSGTIYLTTNGFRLN
jgi:hypothetical protein